MFEEPGKLRWPSPQSVNVGRDSNRVGPPFAKDVENAHCDNVIQSEVCCKQNPCTNTGIQNNESMCQFSNDNTIEGCEQNVENESCRPKGESIGTDCKIATIRSVASDQDVLHENASDDKINAKGTH